jgi:ABC-2 type transport system permease protein
MSAGPSGETATPTTVARRPVPMPVAVLAAEWTKIRTLRSTVWTLLPTVVVGAGLGFVLGSVISASWDTTSPEMRARFDPLFGTFYSLTLGQLPLVVFGVLLVGAEYSSGTIRAGLIAVPRRGHFYGGKLLAGTLLALGVAAVTVITTFFAAQAGLGPRGTTLGAAGVPEATVGACLYLTLMCVFAMGVATMVRNPAITLGVLMPVLFAGSQGLGNIPRVKTVAQYLPDQAGMAIMHITGRQDDPRFAHDFGPWTGLAITAAWALAAVIGGYLVLRRTDV